MKVTGIVWYAFKFLILPAGVILGILMDSASMSELSNFITGYLLSHMDLLTSDNVNTYHLILQVITAPVTLVAWAMPEGSSAFLVLMAITGQIGFYIVVTLLCWAISPPRFLIHGEYSEQQTA